MPEALELRPGVVEDEKPVVENIASKINEASFYSRYNRGVKKPTLKIGENTRHDCIIVTAALRDRDA